MKQQVQPQNEPLFNVKNIKVYFPIKKGVLKKTVGHVKAVDDISLEIFKGETLGIVGESGSGKSTLGRAMLRLLAPTSGQLIFKGKHITDLKQRQIKAHRKDMQMIFQDPFSSLNMKMSVLELVEEPLLIQTNFSKAERKEKVRDIVQKVGLRYEDLQKYPHEFSGGQRQRISIARALVMEPEFVVCDEAVSALDVSIQAQVLNIMKNLQEELGLTYMFISHDLSVVNHMSDRVAVMYLGQIMEIARTEDLYEQALHPYTKALLSSVPVMDEEDKVEKIKLTGDLPSPANPPSGCPFRTRCPFVHERCSEERPQLKERNDGQYVACHLYDA
ncbi:ABC transporter ATP-binding protein [Planomicrobium sp. YIM 101495]|uniref:ABC transporter ATP-binding protein n=1 Tax=Planomicrobium sp. YIM 101495 TaxID=2665160 RepID=UPI0012B776B6|nr:dipeptide ABC transporter ATP-binding protein [Planomicrobium sp. YIM 101495]MTD30737.1 dipeptide ABC transporter ATP-binding protein [Planomicrobium sp. YIM 101495]